MTEGTVVGGAFLELRPKTDGFAVEASAQLVPASRQLGLKVGAAISEGVAPGARATRSEIKQTEDALIKAGGAADLFGRHLSAAHGLVGGLIGFEVARKAAEGIKTAIEYADDLQVTLARNSRTFGDSAEQVDRFGEHAARSFGLSRNEADTLAGSFGTLATRLGVSQDRAAGMSITLTKLAADLAASKGGTAQQAADAIQTALTGRGVALRRYGIVLDNASLKEEAYKLKLIDSTKSALSPATKALASYQLILQGAAGSQDFYRQHLNLTNEKLNTAHKEALNASESLGTALRPAMNAIANLTANDLNPALEGAGKALEALSKYAAARDLVVGFTGVVGVAYAAYRAVKLYDDVKKLSIFNKGAELAARAATAGAMAAEGDAAAVAAAKVEALNLAEKGGGGVRGPGGLPVPPVLPVSAERKALTAAETAAEDIAAGGASVVSRFLGLAKGAAAGAKSLETVGLFAADGIGRIPGFPIIASGGLLKPMLNVNDLARDSNGNYLRGPDGRFLLKGDVKPEMLRSYAPVLNVARQAAINLAGLAAADKQDADKALNAARAQFADPKYRASQASALGGVLAGAFDLQPKSTTGDPTKAAAAAAGAAGTVQAAEDRLRLAQVRLLATRNARKTTALALASATAGVASAQRAVQSAEGKQTAANDAATKAGTPTALSASDLLSRLTGNVQQAVTLRDASKTLVQKGISGPVLEELDKLEKTAAGTLARVAATATPAQIAALNAQKAALDKVSEEFTNAPTQAVLRGLKANDDALTRNATAAGKKAGSAYAAGVIDGLGPLAGLFLPGGQSGGVAPSSTGDPNGLPGAAAATSGPGSQAVAPRSGRDEPRVTVELNGVHSAQVHHIVHQALTTQRRSYTGRAIAQ